MSFPSGNWNSSGTNCAPLLADLFLYSYENEFLDNMIRTGHRRLARSFNLCYRYRYMYLKTYAKFTFCIKSPGHVSNENFFITVCTLLAKFLPTVSEIYKTKRLTFICCLSFQFFSICTSKHTWTFSVIFSKWLHPEL